MSGLLNRTTEVERCTAKARLVVGAREAEGHRILDPEIPHLRCLLQNKQRGVGVHTLGLGVLLVEPIVKRVVEPVIDLVEHGGISVGGSEGRGGVGDLNAASLKDVGELADEQSSKG